MTFNVCAGTDAILLGAETLRGLYPIETISTVGKICAEVIFIFFPEPLCEIRGSVCNILAIFSTLSTFYNGLHLNTYLLAKSSVVGLLYDILRDIFSERSTLVKYMA